MFDDDLERVPIGEHCGDIKTVRLLRRVGRSQFVAESRTTPSDRGRLDDEPDFSPRSNPVGF